MFMIPGSIDIYPYSYSYIYPGKLPLSEPRLWRLFVRDNGERGSFLEQF